MDKECKDCGEKKSLDCFHRHPQTKDGHINQCRVCRAKWTKSHRIKHGRNDTSEVYRRGNLKRKYGISLEDYDDMLASQDGVCAICGEVETRKRMGKVLPLAVDHCHDGGHIRGLLCGACNMGLGSFKDSIDVMMSAIEYIKNDIRRY